MKAATRTATAAKPRSGSRHQPEQTRQAILDAAIREFATEGIAGARTDAIARAAGVNKALLYYYFRDKESLYFAVLDRVFAGLKEVIGEVIGRDLRPREKLLACAAAHFDYIAGSPLFPRLMMREMMRAGRETPRQMTQLVEQYHAPIFAQLAQLIREGIEAGEFRQVDPMQFIPSMVGMVVFYFGAAPVLRIISHCDPLAPERIAARRAAVLDFISAALFQPETAPAARKGVRP